jgi:GH24 family phage-related lysozyme (muramidase)
MSTGPRTLEGRQAIGAATKARMAAGQLQKAQEGRTRWLDAGGREHLARLAKRRAAHLKWKKLMT